MIFFIFLNFRKKYSYLNHYIKLLLETANFAKDYAAHGYRLHFLHSVQQGLVMAWSKIGLASNVSMAPKFSLSKIFQRFSLRNWIFYICCYKVQGETIWKMYMYDKWYDWLKHVSIDLSHVYNPINTNDMHVQHCHYYCQGMDNAQ